MIRATADISADSEIVVQYLPNPTNDSSNLVFDQTV